MKENNKENITSSSDQFFAQRAELNDKVMKYAGTGVKRFFNLDTKCYEDGALDSQTKEILGLVASLVLRCDDCISYHLYNCYSSGLDSNKLSEAANIALVVGGSIVIPHLRRMFDSWDELMSKNNEK